MQYVTVAATRNQQTRGHGDGYEMPGGKRSVEQLPQLRAYSALAWRRRQQSKASVRPSVLAIGRR